MRRRHVRERGPRRWAEARFQFFKWREDHNITRRKVLFGIVLLLALTAGLAVAMMASASSTPNEQVVRINSAGETETGEVVTTTVDGKVKRVIKWRTKEGTTTEVVAGPTHYKTVTGASVYIPGPTQTVQQPGKTTTLPGKTTTLPGETVTLPAVTVTDTVTVPGPTTTITDTITVPGPTTTVTVTETVTVPATP